MPLLRIRKIFIIGVFTTAIAALAYEILAGAALSQLLGASVFYFSLTIGIYLFALGIGSWLSRYFVNRVYEKFIVSLISLSIIGGFTTLWLFFGYVLSQEVIHWLAPFTSYIYLQAGVLAGKVFFHIIAFGYIGIVGILVGLQLPIFSRLANELETVKDALARVFFWDYFGALVASVALPTVLLPAIGIFKTSFVFGAVNAFAAWYFLKLEDHFPVSKTVRRWLTWGIVLAFVVNILGISYADAASRFLEGRLYGGEVLYRVDSPYQRLTYIKDRNDKIRLYLSGDTQFISGNLEASYHESLVHPVMILAPSRERVLILGGGDGLALREVLKYKDVKNVTLVDIDEAMVNSARELPFMRELNRDSFADPRVKVVFDDAFKFVQESPAHTYDAIIVDFPDPTDDSLSRLYSREIYSGIKRLLAAHGIMVIQSNGYRTETQQIIMATLHSAGLYAQPYHPPFEYANPVTDPWLSLGFTLASPDPFFLSSFNVIVPTKILTSATSRWLTTPWPVAAENESSLINTVFRPVIFNSPGDTYTLRLLSKFDLNDLLTAGAMQELLDLIKKAPVL